MQMSLGVRYNTNYTMNKISFDKTLRGPLKATPFLAKNLCEMCVIWSEKMQYLCWLRGNNLHSFW